MFIAWILAFGWVLQSSTLQLQAPIIFKNPQLDFLSPDSTQTLIDSDLVSTAQFFHNKISNLDIQQINSGTDILRRPDLHHYSTEQFVSDGEAMAMQQFPAQQPTSVTSPPSDYEAILTQKIQQGVNLLKVKQDEEKRTGNPLSTKELAALMTSHENRLFTSGDVRRSVVQYRKAKTILVERNVGLIHAVIRSNSHLRKRGSYEELVQEGALGLIRASELYCPSSGNKFSTYATIWIKGVLGNSRFDQAIKIPSREKTKFNKLQAARRRVEGLGLELEGGGTRGDDGEMETNILNARFVESIDHESFSGSSDSSMVVDRHMAEVIEMKVDLVKVLADNLTDREQRMLRLRYGLNDGKSRSLAECARCMGLSNERVRTLGKSSLEKLRLVEGIDALTEYLVSVA